MGFLARRFMWLESIEKNNNNTIVAEQWARADNKLTCIWRSSGELRVVAAVRAGFYGQQLVLVHVTSDSIIL